MKKINLFILSIAVLAGGLFSSCTKEADPEGPQIAFSNSLTETTLAMGVSQWEVNATITSVAGLDQVKVFQVSAGGEDQLGEAITSFTDKNSFNLKVLVTNINVATTIKVSATDKNNVTNSKNFLIKITEAPALDKVTILTATLGSATRNLTDPSYYSIGTKTAYKYNATGASANVDFGYSYGDDNNTTNYATIFSPEWYTSTQKITSPSNVTKFAITTLTVAEFDAITVSDDSKIVTAATGATLQFVNNLQVGASNDGKIIAFVTQSGKKGLIKVGTISKGTNVDFPYASGKVILNIKVQK